MLFGNIDDCILTILSTYYEYISTFVF